MRLFLVELSTLSLHQPLLGFSQVKVERTGGIGKKFKLVQESLEVQNSVAFEKNCLLFVANDIGMFWKTFLFLWSQILQMVYIKIICQGIPSILNVNF